MSGGLNPKVLLKRRTVLHDAYNKYGQDRNRYNSASWRSENQVRYKVIDFSRVSPDKAPFLLTTLDSKRHTPQSKHIFHIHRVNQKPICTVQTWPDDPKDMDKKNNGTSIYMTSFKENPWPQVPKFVHKNKDTKAEGIVPFNLPAENFDVRSEMMLPVCETTQIPSAPNPHKYLLRRRKVPPSFQSSGIFYNNKGEPMQSQSEDRPHSRPPPMNDNSAHVSITSLCGHDFTRRRYIAPPSGILTVTNFDGGAKAIGSNRFDEKYLPFIRAKSVI
ncbi:uncharacterized protein LOC110447782 isoform X2 [Mizuhopecten yessoensis]|uniref:Uncharacterized protein n=1 Tax=Mizuhopecten yessoensis TaxID=6573 RepID=A0A210QUS6_MIZYE|nr:uncharacterized protein LOC110447782 isoform X2 [Mizuhopecten yessoensis]OWF52432.1 hypothetical protein KP79_PYT22169 [Mizuhopecten yessoensis]